MRLPYDLIIMDLECNQPSQKIIEIGAVRLTRNFEIDTDTFQRFVNPNEPIASEIATLCGFSDIEINLIGTAEALAHANRCFYEWATAKTKNVILASWGNFDTSELHAQDPKCQFRRKSLDIKSIAAWEMARWGLKATNSLSASCGAFSVAVQNPPHRALPDARTTALLLQEMWAKNVRFKEALSFAAKALA